MRSKTSMPSWPQKGFPACWSARTTWPARWGTRAIRLIPTSTKAIDTVIAKSRAAKKFVGIGCGVEAAELRGWANRGVQWLLMGADFSLLRKATVDTVAAVRAGLNG